VNLDRFITSVDTKLLKKAEVILPCYSKKGFNSKILKELYIVLYICSDSILSYEDIIKKP